MNPSKKKKRKEKRKLLTFGWLHTAGGASPHKMKKSNWGTPQPTQWAEEGKDSTEAADSLGKVANIRLTSPTGEPLSALTVPQLTQSGLEHGTHTSENTPKPQRTFNRARRLFHKFQKVKGFSEVTTVTCPLASQHTHTQTYMLILPVYLTCMRYIWASGDIRE